MKNRNNNKGFTLVEVLIAVSILAIAIIPLLSNFVTSSKVNLESKRTMNGTTVAQNIMEGISAYGVEKVIVQLENKNATPVELKFMPASMTIGNWGKAKFSTTSTTDPVTGVVTTTPDYIVDRYQDRDNIKELKITDLDESMFTDDTHATINTSFTEKYIYKNVRDNQYYFKADENLHVYSFWMTNVTYGNQKYDILLTMDANKYRGELANSTDTTVDVTSYSRDDMKDHINDTTHDFSKERNYNSLKLAEVITDIGTNEAVNDDVADRYYMEPVNDLQNVITYFWDKCTMGVPKEDVEKKLKRNINITIRKEVNPTDSTKPYWVIKLQYKYKLTDATSLGLSISDEYVEPEVVIYKSCEYPPRNFFFYYLPNYAPTDSVESAIMDYITITNSAGVPATTPGVTGCIGEEVNIYIVRQCEGSMFGHGGGVADTARQTQLDNSDKRYNVQIEVLETVESEGLKTHIFTNTDYSLKDDTKLSTQMGYYRLNGTAVDAKGLAVKNISGINEDTDVENKEDHIYDVTVQVFTAGRNFDKNARLAKFSGSSN